MANVSIPATPPTPSTASGSPAASAQTVLNSGVASTGKGASGSGLSAIRLKATGAARKPGDAASADPNFSAILQGWLGALAQPGGTVPLPIDAPSAKSQGGRKALSAPSIAAGANLPLSDATASLHLGKSIGAGVAYHGAGKGQQQGTDGDTQKTMGSRSTAADAETTQWVSGHQMGTTVAPSLSALPRTSAGIAQTLAQAQAASVVGTAGKLSNQTLVATSLAGSHDELRTLSKSDPTRLSASSSDLVHLVKSTKTAGTGTPPSMTASVASAQLIQHSVLQPTHSEATGTLNLQQAANGSIHDASATHLLNNYAIRQATLGTGTLQIQVQPQNLGPIIISATSQPNGVQLQVMAANPDTLQWLNAQSADMANAIRSSGVALSGLQVASGFSGFQQGQQSQGQSSQPKLHSSTQRVRGVSRGLAVSGADDEVVAVQRFARSWRAHRVNVQV